MSGGEGESTNLSDLGHVTNVLLRRWYAAVPLFLMSLAVAYQQFKSKTPLFKATTTVRVDARPLGVPGLIDGTPGVELSLATELQVMKSREVGKQVMAKIMGDTLSLEVLESRAEAFRKMLTVTQPVRDAAIVQVDVLDPDPTRAALLADAVGEVFADYQARRTRSGGRSTESFIREQLGGLERQLVAAEEQLREWRSSRRVVIPGTEASAVVGRRTELEGRIEDRRIELQTLEALLARQGGAGDSEALRLGTGFRSVLGSPVMQQNPVGGAILSTLLSLEARRAELLGQRTADDPDIRVLDRTIADYERQGELFVGSYMQGLRTEIAGNERGVEQLGTRLEGFPGQELELATLQRNVAVLSELRGTLESRLKEAEIANAAEAPTVELLDRARIPTYRTSPVLTEHLLIGGMAGLIIAVLGALLTDKLDRTVRTRDDIEEATGAPLMGLIPSFGAIYGGTRVLAWAEKLKEKFRSQRARTAARTRREEAAPLIAVADPRHASAEAYRVLRTNLRFATGNGERQVISISSPSPGDGKSTTSLNFAATLALQGKRVLVVDGDMRRGTVHRKLGLTRSPGLSAVLAGELSPEQALQRAPLNDQVGIDVLACGEVPPNPAELLGGHALADLLAWARPNYDTILLDTPPVNLFADGLLLASASDAMLLIGRSAKSTRDELAVAVHQLRSLEVPLVGVILNDFDARRDGRYGRGYSYYYYDRYRYKYYESYIAESRD